MPLTIHQQTVINLLKQGYSFRGNFYNSLVTAINPNTGGQRTFKGNTLKSLVKMGLVDFTPADIVAGASPKYTLVKYPKGRS